MLTFPVNGVRDVIARGQADAETNGGFRKPYSFLPGDGEKPGLWLVGDEGIYLMSNGKLADGARPLVIYARECDPETNPDWHHDKRRLYGGDDGVDFLDAVHLLALLARCPDATHLQIHMAEDSMSLAFVRL